MMLKLLVYAYCTGVFASRRVAVQIEENVAFRYLAAGHSPSHRTICRFRQDHLSAFKDLFVQVVQIAGASGLTKMGTLAIDGTKMKANASKHAAMSYDRMQKEEKRLEQEIAVLTKAAQKADEIDDERFGPHFRGDELPAELEQREERLRRIQEAKQRLEARKAQEDAPKIEAEKRNAPGQKKTHGRPRKHPLGEPKPRDQENFTDPDSRIMKDGSGAFQQCYNAQIAVDSKKQIIVATDVVQSAADNGQLVPMVEAAIENTGEQPKRVLADAGYRSEKAFQALEDKNIEALVSLGREGKSSTFPSPDKPATQRMHRRLHTKSGRRHYAKRKHTVEPPVGWIRRSLGLRNFSLRGLEKVRAEWSLICLALNLKRMDQWIRWT